MVSYKLAELTTTTTTTTFTHRRKGRGGTDPLLLPSDSPGDSVVLSLLRLALRFGVSPLPTLPLPLPPRGVLARGTMPPLPPLPPPPPIMVIC